MASNEAYITTNIIPMYEEADTSRFDSQCEVPQDDPIYEDIDNDSPINIANLQQCLSAEQDGAADSQIASRNVVSFPSPFPAEQDGVACTQIAPRNALSSQSPLAAEQVDVIAPRNAVSLQSPLLAEQDDLTDSQLTFNPAYDAIDEQEHILALDSENVQEQIIIFRSEGTANIIL